MRLLHIHLRREALLLLGEARLLLEPLLRLAAERASAPELLLLRIALLLREAAMLLLRIALLGRKPLLLRSITGLLRKLLRWIALLLLGIPLLRRREPLLLRLLTKTHGRLLHLRPIQGRRRRRGTRVVVGHELLQPLFICLSFCTGRI